MRQSFGALLAAAAIGVAAYGAAIGAAAAQDGDPIKFSIPLPLTGPLAFTGQVQQAGWQSAIEHINNTGGIKGRPIEADFYDDEYKVDLGVAGFKKAASAGDLVFAAGDGTPFVRAISPENNDTYHILMSATGFASDLTDTESYKYNFLTGPTYSDMIDVLYRYMIDNKSGDAAPTVAIVYSATEFGRDPLEHARAKAEELGIDIVLEEETKWSGVDVTASAIKLRNAAPDYVIFHGYAGNVWPEILKTARDYGVEAQFMGTAYNSDPEMVKSVGPAANGYLGVIPFNLVVKDTDAPNMAAIRENLEQWDDKPYTGYANMGYVQSWLTALILREVIGSTLDAGKELNGDNLIAAVNNLDGWDSGGIVGPVTFVDHRIPKAIVYRFNVAEDDFSMEPATDFITVAE